MSTPERKLDAGKPPVQFDERGVGNGMHDRIFRHRQPKGPATATDGLNITAPLLDSTNKFGDSGAGILAAGETRATSIPCPWVSG